MRPLRVYLDSSDFSVLSDPTRRTGQIATVLDDLLAWRNQGKITCYFSGTHLSEMAPTNAMFTDAASHRANLVVDLCGRNALYSQDRIFEGELRFATGHNDSAPEPYSSTGEWYPSCAMEFSPVGQLEVAARITGTIDSLPLNRHARRLVKRKSVKRGKPKRELQAMLVDNARKGSLAEILQQYPMRPQDARILGRYVVGDAAADEATNAFMESLRDPRWMMQWFEKHHDKLSPIIEWTRTPAAKMADSLAEMVKGAESLRRNDAEFGTELADDLLSAARWTKWQDDLLLRIANDLLKDLCSEDARPLTSAILDRACPGLSVGFRSLHSAWRTGTTETPRKPRLSDFPDALHAVYAPYVDVFRADSFMAPHIARHTTQYGTTVVQKLTNLPTAIRELLQGHAPHA